MIPQNPITTEGNPEIISIKLEKTHCDFFINQNLSQGY